MKEFLRKWNRAISLGRMLIRGLVLSLTACFIMASCGHRQSGISVATIPASDNINGHPYIFKPSSKLEHDPDCPQCEKRFEEMVKKAVKEAIMEMEAKRLEESLFGKPRTLRDSADTVTLTFTR